MADQSFAAQFVIGIDANRTIKDELLEALRAQRTRRRVSVTDIINPRQAFFRRTHPEIQTSAERLKLMLAGSGMHELFGKATSTEEFTEQFVECDAVVGKIDVYEEVPLELKTTRSLPADVLVSRPSYVDQLGLYCTMTGKPAGLLVLYRRSIVRQPPLLVAYRVEYLDLAAITREMIRRRDLLEQALSDNDPAGLPKCEWFDLGCDYLSCCGCETAPANERIVPAAAVRMSEDCQLASAMLARLNHAPEPGRGFGLNDLVFPRKAALERTSSAEDQYEPDLNASLQQFERQGLSDALYQALRFGAPGGFARIPVSLRSLQGWVGTYKGVPTLLRTSKFARMIERPRLASTLTHIFDRLALECALTGHERGRLVLYYEVIPTDKFMVYDVWFKDVAAMAAEADRRLQLLETAAPADQLPPCPPWMAKFCRFAPECGCGSSQSTAVPVSSKAA